MNVEQVRSFAMSLPEVTEEPHHHYASFRVRGKIFATLPPGDGHVHVFLGDIDREKALSLHGPYLEKLLWAGKVAGLRVSLAQADAHVVEHLLERAWAHKAPKSLARQELVVATTRRA